MKRILIILAATILPCGHAHADRGTAPNILLIHADDQGYGDFSAQHPDSKIPTPNLDHLAAGGIRFTDAHSSSGICPPSRYALLTGRYHWRQGHGIAGSHGQPWFDKNRYTVGDMLKQKGYRTACKLLWHYTGAGGWTGSSCTTDTVICGSSTDVFMSCLSTEPSPDGSPRLLWRTRVDGIFHESIPAIHGDRAFILCSNGYLYAFN